VSANLGRRSPERRERSNTASTTASSTSSIGGPISGMLHRPHIQEDLRRASLHNNSIETAINTAHLADEKPVAAGNGVSISIALAEPVLFLQGFDQNDTTSRSTTMLRGSLLVRVAKQAKLKSISLNFRGRSETEWPEGIPPRRTEFKDTTTIMNHTWSFFNAQMPQAEYSHGADIIQLQKAPSVSQKEVGVTSAQFAARTSSPAPSMNPRDAKRLSLQANHSRSFGKGDTVGAGPSVAQKGFKVFHPGDYIYNFELPLDSRLPESIAVDLGSVKYELEALVERSGAFRANLVGSKELTMIRAPTEGSLEQTEPIAISRNWEDQLHYDIVISGKSFPLGSSVPIAFKLTPLAKVQCHRIKVFVTENIQYFTSNKRVHRLEPTRKVQLFEKRADGPSVSSYPGSSIRITAGGGIPYDYRAAAAQGEETVPRDTTNLLGNLDNDSGSIGPTEMEFNVQLPSCALMREKVKSERLHFDTTYSNIQVNHWIKVSMKPTILFIVLVLTYSKIVMRLSRPDENDSGKRRHFEISIDSPFNILSCRATQANTSLPAYSPGGQTTSGLDEYECGCPGATLRRRNTPPVSSQQSAINLLNQNQNSSSSDLNAPAPPGAPHRSWTSDTGGLALPTRAHVHGYNDPNQGAVRPMHLLRNPSFNPPPFDEDEPPPPLVTPPPNYENLVAGSPNALADYFARLADEQGDEDDRGDRSRIDFPLTPGGRVNRSMDVSRTWLPLGGAVANAVPARDSTPLAR
jgi:hypothetical protein